MRKMTQMDYRIYEVDSVDMGVVAHMTGLCMEWPATITDHATGKVYEFKYNDIMQEWMIGTYSGHARYTCID